MLFRSKSPQVMPATGAFRKDLIKSNWLCPFMRRMGWKGRRDFLALAVALAGRSSRLRAEGFGGVALAGPQFVAVVAGVFSVLRLLWLRRNGLGGGGGGTAAGVEEVGTGFDTGTTGAADGFGGDNIGVSGIISGSLALETTCCFLARPASVPEADAVPLLRFSAAYAALSLIFAITSSIADSSRVT